MSSAINATPNHYFFEASTKVVARVAPINKTVAFVKDNPKVLFDLLSRVYLGHGRSVAPDGPPDGGRCQKPAAIRTTNSAYRFGETRTDGSVYINLNEGDLAKHSGLARETVSRNIQNLKALSLVEIRSDGIILNKPDQLENMLGEDI